MSKNRDSLIIGFALFAMFFGAGNLIFPPYLGWESGSAWLAAALCFIFIDIGMSLLALIAIARNGKGSSGLTDKLGTRLSFLILSLNCLCIGPFVAIPRTAAITYEVGIAPLIGDMNSWLCTGIFFGISFLLSIRQSKVVDIVGKFMAPLMFVALVVLIIKGIVTPLGEIASSGQVGEAVRTGLLNGYQTMDMMAATIFSVAVLLSIRQKGYEQKSQQVELITKGGIVATVLLFIVYGGLAYIGATASVTVTEELTQAQLLIVVTEGLMGKPGQILLSVIVIFACLTTAVGLFTSISSFFAEKLHIRYEILVTVFTLVSWVISNFGTSVIISMAAPVLDLIYPVLIMLIILGLFQNRIGSDPVCRLAALGAFAAAVLLLIGDIFGIEIISEVLPFSALGFGWLVPAVLCAGVGLLVAGRSKTL